MFNFNGNRRGVIGKIDWGVMEFGVVALHIDADPSASTSHLE
jgi:hypothetical protein